MLVPIWIDNFLAIKRYRSSKTTCRTDDCIDRKVTSVCTGRKQFENATTEQCRREKTASPRQAARRRSEGAAITHWPCDSEPEGWLDK